jgi:hypothetical protein
MPNCTALKAYGILCGKSIAQHATLCGIHRTSQENSGPNTFELKQLKIKHKKERMDMINYHSNMMFQFQENLPPIPAGITNFIQYRALQRAELQGRIDTECAELKLRQRREIVQMNQRHTTERLANGGIDPDQAAKDREIVRNQKRQVDRLFAMLIQNPTQRNIDRIADRLNIIRARIEGLIRNGFGGDGGVLELHALRENITMRIQTFIIAQAQLNPVAPVVQANPNENLGAFSRDNQNVHTTVAVEQTRKNIAEILKIPVPEDFRWNTKKLPETYKQIIIFCKLSPKAVWQFSSMYCSDATIYDMEPGIFGKVMDGVWQFISNSPDKVDLIEILGAELTDNIGMCAQGNLSRVCNVLQGYMEGIGQKESVSTILGREFSKLLDVENDTERVHQGIEILKNNNVPEIEWESWLEPLRS